MRQLLLELLIISLPLGGVVKQDNPRLKWGKWAKAEPDGNGVILCGWPLQEPPVALSYIYNTDDMQTVLDAIVRRDCRFELIKKQKKSGTGDSGTGDCTYCYVFHFLFHIYNTPPGD